ncbi:MFS multidrug transporter [Leucogyrophana mollusca]|uniref:MFS multidrug transporter n=1 Tax=Leucogyrophana mollusca TaxID=85980 RepID=A0ACB8B2W8_9AGAM|nr:MFS multidrug transporter [Leucogyrophana mollusca]
MASHDSLATTNVKQKRGARFWLIFLGLCVSLFLSALDSSAVYNALPVIVNDLQGTQFTWIGTAYNLASAAFLPMSGCAAEIFGRRTAFVCALLAFALGSALCGSAKSMTWLIAARTVQGVGGGAILSLASIVVSDMVSLQERGTYNGLIGLTWAFAMAIGPVVGGSFAQNGNWRWLFYINLPISGAALLLVVLFMNLPTPPGTLKEKLARMDWIGNALVMSSTTSLVIGLTWGGVLYPWTSARVIIPLVLGICGLGVFLFYEMRYATSPMVPRLLFTNRTTMSGYLQNFCNSLAVMSCIYYFPVYFQACKDALPIRSGINMFGVTFVVGPFIVFGGLSVTKFQVYRPQLWAGWVASVLGAGGFSTVGADTVLGVSVGVPALWAAGGGILFAATYFPVLSPLPVSANAHALAFFAFLRSFALIWAVTIGSAILTNQLAKWLPSDFVATIPGGASNIYAIIPEVRNLPEPLRSEVRQAFSQSLRPLWYTAVGILVMGFIASLFMSDVPLHNYIDEKWAMEEKSSGEELSQPA